MPPAAIRLLHRSSTSTLGQTHSMLGLAGIRTSLAVGQEYCLDFAAGAVGNQTDVTRRIVNSSAVAESK